jgi:hypothetical protein
MGKVFGFVFSGLDLLHVGPLHRAVHGGAGFGETLRPRPRPRRSRPRRQTGGGAHAPFENKTGVSEAGASATNQKL